VWVWMDVDVRVRSVARAVSLVVAGVWNAGAVSIERTVGGRRQAEGGGGGLRQKKFESDGWA
jgi:hypothetical protein